MIKIINFNKKSSVLNSRVTKKSPEPVIVLLTTTSNQLLSMYLVRMQMYEWWQMTLNCVKESKNKRKIQRKQLLTLLILIVLCCTNGTVHINDSVHYLLALCTIKVFDKGKLSQFWIFQLQWWFICWCSWWYVNSVKLSKYYYIFYWKIFHL